jgi:hypothetical protein
MMKKRRVKLITALFCVLALSGINTYAQVNAFKYRADIKKIDSAGIYKIELNPGLIAKSAKGLYDIRLFDNTGKTVAYALSNNLSAGTQDSFIEFPAVNSSPETDTATVYISENVNRLNVNQLWIDLKNTSVNRNVNLTGSDDLKTWFAIKEGIQLQDAGESGKPDYEQSFSFPTSNYRYFKIQVNGKNKAPVKILRSGIYLTQSNQPEYAELPPVKFTKTDTGKKTSIFIRFDEPYLVNKLHLNITGPKYYSRKAVVYTTDKNFDNVNADAICDTVLNSSGTQDLVLSAKTKYIRIDIFNGDDNPLQVTSVKAYQLKQYIISYLAGGHDYYILTGDSLAKNVNYDLSFLKYCSIDKLPVITTNNAYKNSGYAIATTPQPKHDIGLWIWLSMLIALALLSFLTVKMTRKIQ